MSPRLAGRFLTTGPPGKPWLRVSEDEPAEHSLLASGDQAAGSRRLGPGTHSREAQRATQGKGRTQGRGACPARGPWKPVCTAPTVSWGHVAVNYSPSREVFSRAEQQLTVQGLLTH